MLVSHISSLFIGKPKKFRGDGEYSSISRSLTQGPILLTETGLAGDQVADTINHGGPDKALHLYPLEHYDYWRSKLGPHRLLEQAGAFGENISANDLSEDKVKIGDRFQIGKAIIEISHGRQPCWKIEHHFGVKKMVSDILKTGYCGLYFRVIQNGLIAQGDKIEQINNLDHDWTVQRVFMLLYS